MSVPRSVIRTTKDGVKIISNVDKTNYFMFELCRAALRDSAKLVLRRFKDNYYQHFKKRTGKAGKNIEYTVLSSKKTLYPRVHIGIKRGRKSGFYALFQEVGTSRTPRLKILTKSVEGNVAEIVKIQSLYLSALEDEARVLALIDENEMKGDGNDE